MLTPKTPRGFAAMTPEKRSRISSLGGKAAFAKGVGHRFTPEEARRAGRKGGLAISEDRYHMARIGSKGGITRGEKAQAFGKTIQGDKSRHGFAEDRDLPTVEDSPID
jgi:general stress protein YciG